MLPRALSAYNDLPGESGHSPYQLVFGRERIGRGPELPTAHQAEDITAFMERVKLADAALQEKLQALQHKRKEAYDKRRLAPHFYKKGDRCWVEKPPASPKEQPHFHGPCLITAVEGPTSYEVQVVEGQHRSCAVDQLRPYYSPLVGEAWPLFYTRHDAACNPAKPDDWIC